MRNLLRALLLYTPLALLPLSAKAAIKLTGAGGGASSIVEVTDSTGAWTLNGTTIYNATTSYNVAIGVNTAGSMKLRVAGPSYFQDANGSGVVMRLVQPLSGVQSEDWFFIGNNREFQLNSDFSLDITASVQNGVLTHHFQNSHGSGSVRLRLAGGSDATNEYVELRSFAGGSTEAGLSEFYDYGLVRTGSGQAGLAFATNGGTTRGITFDNAGNVLIATNTSATARLAVWGTQFNFPVAQLRSSTNTTAAILEVIPATMTSASNGRGIGVKLSGDSDYRGVWYATGTVGWGTGAATPDVFLQRSAANTLRVTTDGGSTGGHLQVQNITIDGTCTGSGCGGGGSWTNSPSTVTYTDDFVVAGATFTNVSIPLTVHNATKANIAFRVQSATAAVASRNVVWDTHQDASTTTDGTTTTLRTISMAANSTLFTEANVTAAALGATAIHNAYTIQAAFQRAQGNASQIGSASSSVFESSTPWNVFWEVSGTDVLLRALGSNTATVIWDATVFSMMTSTTGAAAAGGGGPAPGTLLAGNNGIETNEDLVNPNAVYTYTGGYTAAESGTVATGYYYGRRATSGPMKMLIYSAAGSLLGTSDALTVGESDAWHEFTFASGPTLTASTVYHIAVIADGYFYLKYEGGSWSTTENTGGSYASPPASITISGDTSLGGPHSMYVTN